MSPSSLASQVQGLTPAMSWSGQVDDELREALWRDCGLIRDFAGLERLRASSHLLTRLIAESALIREESRGSHFRADFPVENPSLERHVVLRLGHEPRLETWL